MTILRPKDHTRIRQWPVPATRPPSFLAPVGIVFVSLSVILLAMSLWMFGRQTEQDINALQHQLDQMNQQNTKLEQQVKQLQDKAAKATSAPATHGIASWLIYSTPDTCAALQWPKGTRLKVQAGNRWIVCVRRDSGPYVPGRIIDLNLEQFRQLADPRQGLIHVTVTPI